MTTQRPYPSPLSSLSLKKDLIYQVTEKLTDSGEWVCEQGKITKGQISIVNNFHIVSYFVQLNPNLLNNLFSFVKPTLDNSFSNIEEAINFLISSEKVIEIYNELIKNDIEKEEFWSGILGAIGRFENTLTNGNFLDCEFNPQYRYRYWVSKKGNSKTKEFYSLEECINYLLENKIG